MESFGEGSARFDAVAVAPNGNIIGMQAVDALARIFTPTGVLVEAWDVAWPGDDHLVGPRAVAFDKSGEIFIVDTAQERIEVFFATFTPVIPATWSAIKALGVKR